MTFIWPSMLWLLALLPLLVLLYVWLLRKKRCTTVRLASVQVAKLAGVPPAVVARAREVLERLESEAESPARLEGLPLFASVAPTPVKHGPSPVEEALKGMEPDGMSPREAMEALYRLKGML
jgi:DNA mismatch repair protein MutS